MNVENCGRGRGEGGRGRGRGCEGRGGGRGGRRLLRHSQPSDYLGKHSSVPVSRLGRFVVAMVATTTTPLSDVPAVGGGTTNGPSATVTKAAFDEKLLESGASAAIDEVSHPKISAASTDSVPVVAAVPHDEAFHMMSQGDEVIA